MATVINKLQTTYSKQKPTDQLLLCLIWPGCAEFRPLISQGFKPHVVLRIQVTRLYFSIFGFYLQRKMGNGMSSNKGCALFKSFAVPAYTKLHCILHLSSDL